MGTRSSYAVIEEYRDENHKKVTSKYMAMYVQYDGYPDGHPLDVAKWLSGGNVVNGIPMREDKKLIFNGSGCLAAQLVARMKVDVGNVYMQPFKHRGFSGEEYLYDIIVNLDRKDIKIIAYELYNKKVKIFEGTPQEFCERFEPKEDD